MKMDFHNSVVVVFFMAFICQSYEFSPPVNPPTFDDGYTVNFILSSLAFDGQISSQGVIGPNARISVNVDPTSVSNASFMIFQVHSYIKPLVLSTPSQQPWPLSLDDDKVNGTDIGLYSKLNSKVVTYHILNPYSEPVQLLLVPMLYNSKVPVPGGCNLSFSVNMAPFMTLTYQNDNEIIQVDAQAASLQDQPDCRPLGLSYEVYELPLWNTSAESYFNSIISIITPGGAELKGFKTRKPIHQPELRRRFASYPGLGSVYVVTVRNTLTGESSAYVPIAKYGCIDGNDDTCNTYVLCIWMLCISAIVFIIAEIRYILGGSMKVFMRIVFLVVSLIIFLTAVPSPLRWIFYGFLSALIILCMCEQLGPILRSIFTEHAYALLPAHVMFGLSLHAGLGLIPGFQDWFVVMLSYGMYFLVFYIVTSIFPKRRFDVAFGIFVLVALISAVTKGVIFYVFVDPTRILRREFSDVIFSPPVSLADKMLLTSWFLLMAMYFWACKATGLRSRSGEYQEL